MQQTSHDRLVDDQFGPRAAAYLASAVHAQGEDLDALVSLVRGRPDADVLDLGCGAGHVSFAVAPQVRSVTACDLASDMLRVVDAAAAGRGLVNLRTEQAVAERLPFRDAAFDVVLSRYSAHHWRDFDAGLREAARVLRPGGMLAVVDSISPGAAALDTWLQAVELLRDVSHVRSRAPAEWDAALARAGLLTEQARSFRIRLVYAVWIERMRTPPERAAAIRSLQAVASDRVARHFAIEPDGSFCIDVGLFAARKPGDGAARRDGA